MASEQASGGSRSAGIGRGAAISIFVDGKEMRAFEGETVLAVLWANGRHTLHTTARSHEPRGFFCGIGVCFDCLVTIDGIVNLRACVEPVRQGMEITLQRDAGYAHAS
jgi:predicted molibdopterin-dependent oxidoreductase YjgC